MTKQAIKQDPKNKKLILPEQYDAVLFDMDGVVTRTAAVHFAAWKKIFDNFLKQESNGKFKEFTQEDYLEYVDGKPREDGVTSFLASRKITLPEGDKSDKPGTETAEKPDTKADTTSNTKSGHKPKTKADATSGTKAGDKPSTETVASLAQKKDEEFLRLIHENGVEPYETTIELIKALRRANVKTALVTASKNGQEILKVTNLAQLFDATVTGIDAEKLHLKGKPAPDVFLEAAKRLSVKPERAVVVEDAEAGVAAGHNGKFGLVIGVARQNNSDALLKHGADIAVRDLAEIKSAQKPEDIRGMTLADLDVTDANWVVTYDNYDPKHEKQRESLCALGNGKFCTRGASFESVSDENHYPGTYVAGCYDTTNLEVSEQGKFDREELVNMPNWLSLNFKIDDGVWFSIDKVEVLKYSQRLNLKEGILYRDLTIRDNKGRETKLSERRFVHMRFSHIGGIELRITSVNWDGKLTIRSGIDATILNSGDEIEKRFAAIKHLKTIDKDEEDKYIGIKVITSDTKVVVAMAARTEFVVEDQVLEPTRKKIEEEESIAQEVTIDLKKSQTCKTQKTCSMYTSRDRGIYEPKLTASEEVRDSFPFDELVERQVDAWRSLWRQFDLFIETNEDNSKLIPSLLLHLNSFHTLQTASTHTVDLDTGVPARGWTGEGYQGHVFWDELFVFPFINFRMPNISAALLKYRYRRLREARKIAERYGAKGACFPWQSASDGKERTPNYWWMSSEKKWIRDYTHLELHVNGAVAYNVWQYYQVTADDDFMYSYGSEILLEIARFFATYAKFNKERERYEIHGVIGPDEFHNGYPNFKQAGVNNNAYTNIMAAWTIARALELLDKLPADHQHHISSRLQIDDAELKLWKKVSTKMYVPLMTNGVIEQFEGYEQLKEFPTDDDGHVSIEEMNRQLKANFGYLNQYKLSKQADVLMLGFLFFPDDLKKLLTSMGLPESAANLEKMAEYYIPRTANQSTLSRVALAWVLSRLDRLSYKAKEATATLSQSQENHIFYEALGSDYYDVASRGTTKSGIHMGAMAGTVDIVQRCYTGLAVRDDVLHFDPKLPEQLVRLSFTLHYRGQSLAIDMHQDQMTIHAHHSTALPIKVGYDGQTFTLNCGDTKVVSLKR